MQTVVDENAQLVCNTSMLLASRQEGRSACKSSATTIPKNSLLRTDLTWSDSGKMAQLNKSRV